MTQDQFSKVTEWQDATFVNSTAISRLKHLAKEVKETEEAIIEHPNDGEIQFPVELEFADCFFLLYGAAKAAGMTYEQICQAIELKLEINKDRVWGKPDENGVVEHIKGAKKFSTDEQF